MEHLTLTSLFTDIATAIRLKTGKSDLIIADNFPYEILDIPTESPLQEKTAVPSASDVVTTPDEGYALSKVTTKAVSLVGTASNILTGTSVSVQSNGGTITSLAGTMPNNGAISKDDLAPGSTYTIPSGYTTGGSVKARANSGTVVVDERRSDFDMGQTSSYRYVNTMSVPNYNTATYTWPDSVTTNTVTFSEDHNYVTINALSVFNRGSSNGYALALATYEIKTGSLSNSGLFIGTNAAGEEAYSLAFSNSYNKGYSTGEAKGKSDWLPDSVNVAQNGNVTVYNAASSVVLSTTTANSYNAGVAATKKGTATSPNVLIGYTFTNSSSVNVSGSMPNNGTLSSTITTNGGTYTIPSGYTSGGTVTASIPTETKSITVNGTYTPTSGKYFSQVTVNVQASTGKVYRIGSGEPSSSLGSNGDIYIDLG